MITNQALRGWIRGKDVGQKRSEIGFEAGAGLDRCRQLVRAKYLGSSRCILKTEAGDRGVLLGCRQSAVPNGEARKYSGFYYCLLNVGLLRSVFWLTAAVWASDRFLGDVGQPARQTDWIALTGIPPGLELVWWTAHDDSPRALERQPAWLAEALEAMDEERRSRLWQTYQVAVDYLWLHELAHIACGHTDNSRRSMNHDDAPRTNPGETSSKRGERLQAMEIEADRWAFQRIFASQTAVGTSDKRGTEHYIPVQVATTAIVLVHILFFAKRVLKRNSFSENSSNHPPLWFRTDDMLRMQRITASSSEGSRTNGRRAFASDISAIAEACAIRQALMDLANVHPLFGLWMGPVIDESRRRAADQVLAAAKSALCPTTETRQPKELRVERAEG